MKKLIVSNWKNLPKTLAEAEEILEYINEYLESLGETKEFSLVFCPPFVFLEEVGKILATSHLEHEASLGAQDMAENLKKINVRYVIVGHSDRRWGLGESDKIVNEKLKLVLQNEMIPVVCLGERTREGDYKSFLENQTLKTFDGINADDMAKCIIAYEPVWAISTELNAKPDTPESALESMAVIKKILLEAFDFGLLTLPRMLYGGSVTSKNVRDFIAHDEIGGVLVGGASVDKEEFVEILKIAGNI